MKRVLLAITGLGLGGAETQVVQLATRLKQRGWEILVVSLILPGPLAARLAEAGIPVASLGMRSPLSLVPAMVRLARLVRRWRPEIVHAHMFHANVLCRLVRPIAPFPVLICTAHSTYEAASRVKQRREVTWRELAYRLTDPLCDLTTHVSEAGLSRYVAVRAARARKIRHIPNGIDTNVFYPNSEARGACRRELGIEDKFVWLAVGRLEVQKDYPTLLRAFALLGNRGQVLLVAGEGRLRAELEELSASLRLTGRVRFLGARRDIPALMNAADGFVVSSIYEGLPMVLLEAQAAGLPAVATDVGGNKEVVLDGQTGYLVPSGDPRGLAEAMLRVMNMSPEERLKLGEAGRRHVEERYSLDRVTDLWETLYNDLVVRKAGPTG